jgi:hypothetical protein
MYESAIQKFQKSPDFHPSKPKSGLPEAPAGVNADDTGQDWQFKPFVS